MPLDIPTIQIRYTWIARQIDYHRFAPIWFLKSWPDWSHHINGINHRLFFYCRFTSFLLNKTLKLKPIHQFSNWRLMKNQSLRIFLLWWPYKGITECVKVHYACEWCYFTASVDFSTSLFDFCLALNNSVCNLAICFCKTITWFCVCSRIAFDSSIFSTAFW